MNDPSNEVLAGAKGKTDGVATAATAEEEVFVTTVARSHEAVNSATATVTRVEGGESSWKRNGCNT